MDAARYHQGPPPRPFMQRKIRIGDWLVEHGHATLKDIEAAERFARDNGKRLGEACVARSIITRKTLAQALAAIAHKRYVDLAAWDGGYSIETLPARIAAEHKALCLTEGGRLLVAVADPGDVPVIDKVRAHLPERHRNSCEFVGAADDEIAEILRRSSDSSQESHKQAGALIKSLGVGGREEDDRVEDTEARRFLLQIIGAAIGERASDIHIDPTERGVLVRFRIDGRLTKHLDRPEHRLAEVLANRLKMDAGLKTDERRRPQDGKITFPYEGREMHARLSTMPTAHGEKIVLRIMGQAADRSLDDLGFHTDDLGALRRALSRTNGLILVTGPTGSGKTTTLYSAIRELNKPDHNIMTAEDPVETLIPGVAQTQINDAIGLGFADTLRGFLRLDPDIIMIGEMRDHETAETGVRAAMTGHLVLSTLHTNDAASTPTRLTDMGVEGFNAASVLRLVVAQRLVRLACPHCARPEADPARMAWARSVMDADGFADVSGGTPAQGAGCEKCRGTGWSGRVGIHECLEFDDALADVLAHGRREEFIREARARMAGRTMAARAARMALMGLTSLAEAQSATSG